jgi:hypothetical protein
VATDPLYSVIRCCFDLQASSITKTIVEDAASHGNPNGAPQNAIATMADVAMLRRSAARFND